MVNRAYLLLSGLSLVLWVLAFRHMPGIVAGLTLAGIVGFSLWCEYSRVTTLARIGNARRRPISHGSGRPTGRTPKGRDLK